ncbi:flavin monoamine oxidase family protein [Haloplasma contractile]|uniref:Monoamine oxidase protein n=1 Tax=Haloplasma contractile SSD-17B TaxID=1033810 RepID=U2E9Q8_9MOLU|nr:NAD(P)/FAD-dependent oxidoreductase [Haloplasma contractile]ERJ11571.1 monoamine oxidase protein [Haloplasma contractile SSD-17B]
MNFNREKQIQQVMNPSRADRHALLKKALNELNRLEDFDDIVKIASPPPDIREILPSGSCKGIKIGIIGAGSAGLAAAHELRKLGFDITILEGEKEHIGGRIHTHYFNQNLYGELGPMRIPVSHETVWHYINKFNLKTNPFLQRTMNNIMYVKNTRIVGQDIDEEIRKYLYPLFNMREAERNTSLSSLIEFIYNYPIVQTKPEIRKFLFAIREFYPYRINLIDNISLRKACEQLVISEGAINFLTAVLGIDRNLFYNNFLEMTREEYFASYSYVYEIGGGLHKLPEAFYKDLMTPKAGLSNITFKQGCRVTGIYQPNSKGNVMLRYLNRNTNQSINEEFDYVVCTIPFSTLRVIDIYPQFSNLKMRAIREVNYSTSQKTALLCNERFWERTIGGETIIGGGAITDLPINTMWYPSHKYNERYGVLTGSYNIAEDATRIGNLSDEFRFKTIKRQVEEVHNLPRGYLDHVVEDYQTINWERRDLYLGAFTVYYPEQNRLFAYPTTLPEFNDRVYFAGEHVSPFHAWIQGALQTGMVTANMLATNCKMRKDNLKKCE